MIYSGEFFFFFLVNDTLDSGTATWQVGSQNLEPFPLVLGVLCDLFRYDGPRYLSIWS